jgi:peptidoglycan/LPS O-acetylase OafA/YrhL
MIGEKSGEPTCWLDRDRANALNLLRLVFALTVLFSHSWSLAKLPASPIDAAFEFLGGAAGNAVNGFFIISGFLITASWFSGRGAESYLRARIARILPGFAVAFIFSAFVASFAAGDDWLRYLRSIPKQSWFVGIFTFDQIELERALSFAHNPYPRTVNGSMWTIPIEFGCYLAVALVGSVGIFRRRWLVGLFVVFAMSLAIYEQRFLPDQAWKNWPRFAVYFGAGTLLYLYRHQVPKNGWLALLALGLVGLTPFLSPFVTLPFAGAYLIFYGAYSAPDFMKRIGSKNDVSYGAYLYGFPLQQLYYNYAVKDLLPMNPWINFAVVLPVCLALGWLSWLYVEKPAKNWLR